jgi:hypothetical protein
LAAMSQRLRTLITDITAALLFGLALALAVPQAHAEIISTDASVQDSEKSRVKDMLARPEVAAEMQKMGIAPAEAAARVDAMTPEEVRSLAGRLDNLPAGGQTRTDTILIIILIVLIIALII